VPDPQERESLRGIFLMEAWDTLATLEDGAGRLQARETTRVGLEPLLVVSHRLKGAAALHGFPELAGLAGALEQVLDGAPALPAAERGAAADFLVDLVALLKRLLDGIGATGQEDAAEVAAFRADHPAFFATPTAAPAAGPAAPPGGLRGEVERFFAENPDVLDYFRPEAAEHLETMTQALLALAEGASEEQLGSLFRAVHTLKGAAYTVGCAAVGDLAHRVEDLLVAVREDRVPLTPPVVETVLVATDALRLLLGLGEALPAEVDALAGAAVTQLARLMPASDAGPPAAGPALTGPTADLGERSDPTPGAIDRPAPAAAERQAGAAADRPAAAPLPARRPAVVGPAIRVSLQRLDSLMNLVGELVIARSRLDRRLQDLDRVGELLLFSQARMTKAVKDFEVKRAAGGGSPPMAAGHDGGGSPGPGGDGTDAGAHLPLTQLFAELEFDRYDDFDILARRVAEMSADLAEVQTQVAGLIRTIWEDTGHIQQLTGRLRGEITRARMVPVGKLLARFVRQVREGARTAGKAAALEVSGESVEMDNSLVEALADPLLHLVQNAIAHGIEPEDERRARGKSPQGTVSLRAAHRGGFVEVEVEDDGRGIDVELLKAAAVRQGMIRGEEADRLTPAEALALIWLPGFSTTPVVTTASGRGVGLDVVRSNVSRLNGEIAVKSEPGVGTRFTLRLPLTVLISDALMVRVGGETLAIPLSAVKQILTVRPDAVQSVGRTEMVRVGDELVELSWLDRLLGLARMAPRGPIPVVVLRAGGGSLAVAVEELGGKEEIVIKSLGAFLQEIGPFTGATISGEGRVILLVDPGRLAELAEGPAPSPAARRDGVEEPEAARARPAAEAARRVLLVDDSVSVRKFVGHMLERAGFRVVTATDGAEALQHLGETTVDAVITDLEMPRVNGYELIEDLRRRPTTRDLPVVVLTTRVGDKHLALARRLGVEHYVSKPVDEQRFVRLIDTLTAGARAEAELSGVTG
jgi:chemosensory pili system protein ChpA (sensor histidine kinase/response regulator)